MWRLLESDCPSSIGYFPGETVIGREVKKGTGATGADPVLPAGINVAGGSRFQEMVERRGGDGIGRILTGGTDEGPVRPPPPVIKEVSDNTVYDSYRFIELPGTSSPGSGLLLDLGDSRLEQQFEFIREIDRLKTVVRETYLADLSRKENSAEHSWQLALMAVVLREHVDEDVDLERVVKMVLLHDVVEVDAGDTYAYADEREEQIEREREAAERIFGILPEDQEETFRELWEEFEARETPEARYAKALDRLQPLLHNHFTDGEAWKEHGLHAEEVLERNDLIGESSEQLWDVVEELVDHAVEKGWLKAGEGSRHSSS